MITDSKMLDGVVIFSQVVTNGSFTKTADQTGHSTSYISKEVNKLESRLGVRLLNRTTRTLKLTPEGELYYQQCLRVLEDLCEVEQVLDGAKTEPQGTLKISCPVSFGASKFGPIFTQFLLKYPQVNLDIELSDTKVDLIEEGYDLVIRASGSLEDSNLICKRIMSSTDVTIASPEYIQRKGMPKHPNELIEHDIIGYKNSPQPKVWDYVGHSGEKIVVKMEPRIISNLSEMKVEFCLAGLGITRLPIINVLDELNSGQLVEVFPDYENYKIDCFLVYPSRKYMSAKVRCFIDFFTQSVME
ncbi:MAG: LysR family transcriptional regulator [Gammaproteobacteria bacterium MedPE]|nr:MAG: LysR family transcriptional regulator [Gammaproteobacteria bacterium MedPE]